MEAVGGKLENEGHKTQDDSSKTGFFRVSLQSVSKTPSPTEMLQVQTSISASIIWHLHSLQQHQRQTKKSFFSFTSYGMSERIFFLHPKLVYLGSSYLKSDQPLICGVFAKTLSKHPSKLQKMCSSDHKSEYYELVWDSSGGELVITGIYIGLMFRQAEIPLLFPHSLDSKIKDFMWNNDWIHQNESTKLTIQKPWMFTKEEANIHKVSGAGLEEAGAILKQ